MRGSILEGPTAHAEAIGQPELERSMAQHTHEFDCKTCGAHLDSREELDQHNRTNHPDATRSSQGQSASGGGDGSSGKPRASGSNPSDQRG
jgi:hypothetical protein